MDERVDDFGVCESRLNAVRIAWVSSSEPPPGIVARLRSPPLRAEVQHVSPGRALRDVCTRALDCVVTDFRGDWPAARKFLQNARTQKSRMELPILLLFSSAEGHDAAFIKRLEAFRLGASDCWMGMPPASEWVARIQVLVETARHHKILQMMLQKQQLLIDTDPLTGLANRRAFRRRLESELTREKRRGQGLALVLMDIDHFKAINDTYGHPMGDAVLQGLAKLLRRQARSYDSIARLGGEEFALLLFDVSRNAAWRAAERVRESVASYAFPPLAPGALTLSAGIAQGPLHAYDSFDDMFLRADQALYDAKHGGRNQSVLSSTTRHPLLSTSTRAHIPAGHSREAAET